MRPFLSLDVETSGTLPEMALQPWRVSQGKAWITTFALAWRGSAETKPMKSAGKVLVDVDNPPDYDRIRVELRKALQLVIDGRFIVVGWNIPFDIAWLIAYGCLDLVVKIAWLDGQRLWKHVDNTPTWQGVRHYNLELANKTFEPVYFGGYKHDVDYHDPSVVARAALLVYNKKDTEATLLHVERFWPQLTERQQRCVQIEAGCIWQIANANLIGMHVDHDNAMALDHVMREVGNKLAARLAPHNCVEKDIRSPAKLRKLLFDRWGLPIVKYTVNAKTGLETDQPSTDKEVLQELATDDDRALWVGQWREALNLRTKFVTSLRKSVIYNEAGDVTHPQAIMFGTYTSRMTYASKQGRGVTERPTGFALHQMKNDKRFRRSIKAPPDHDIVEADAAGQEFRWMAILSGDPVMLELCHGGDPHSYLAAEIYDEDYSELRMMVKSKDDAIAEAANKKRKLGKVGNLCIAEGTRVLTDRGFCNIEHVRIDDKVWDGIEFVNHAGLSFSGVLPVMTYDGLTATHEHEVFTVGQGKQDFSDAARHGWIIEPAMGSGWASVGRSAVRIVDGVGSRAIHKVWRAVREGAVRLWSGAGREPSFYGAGSIGAVQGLRSSPASQATREANRDICCRQAIAETCQRNDATLQQSKRSIVSQLRGSWDQVQVCLGARWGKVDQDQPATRHILSRRDRPRAERWSLRAWKFAAGNKAGQPCEQTARCYDIVDCGPRHRFVAAGLVVHNSLQYRTSKKKLRIVARVQHGMAMDIELAAHTWNTYRRTYELVPVYWRNQIAKAKMQGWVETIPGRRVAVTGDWDAHQWALESTAINDPIQGTGGEQKYLALLMLQNIVQMYNASFAWDLHDGIYFYVPKAKSMAFAHAMKNILDNLPYKRAWDFVPPCPLPWDCKIGPTWGDLKEIEFE